MAKMNEKQLILVTLAATVLPTLFFCYLLYGDYQVWSDVNQQKMDTQDEIDRKNKDIYKIPAIQSDLDNQAHTFEQDVKVLPSQKDLDTLLKNMRELATKSDVTNVQELNPQKVAATRRGKTTPDFNAHIYTMKFTANFKTFADFVNAIETNTRFLQVSRLKVEPAKSRGGRSGNMPQGDDLSCDLKIVTYSYTKAIEAMDMVYTPKPVAGAPEIEEASDEPRDPPYVPRSGWRDPYKSQLRDRLDTTKTPGPGTDQQPTTSNQPGAELVIQQQQVDQLNNRLRGLELVWQEKRYGEIIGKLDEFEVVWAAKIPLGDEKLRQEAEQLNERYKLIKKNVLDDMKFIREWANLRLEDIQENFRTAERSNKKADFEKVVDEHKKMGATLERYLGRESHPDVQSIVTRANEFAERADTRLEFKDLPLKVVGIAYLFAPGSQDLSRAVVLYNGESHELDALEVKDIEGNPDLRLHAVTDDGAIFQYKGELIHKGIEDEDEDEVRSTRGSGGRRVGPGSRPRPTRRR